MAPGVRQDDPRCAQINLKSDLGKFDLGRDVTSLSGNVVVTTSTGYRIETDALQTKMSELDIRTPGEIRANSPIGTVTAGQMHLYSPAPNDPAQLIFTNGVKLIYVPKQVKE